MLLNFEDYTTDLTEKDIPAILLVKDYLENLIHDKNVYINEIMDYCLMNNIKITKLKGTKIIQLIRNNPNYFLNSGQIVSASNGYQVTLNPDKIEKCAKSFDQRENSARITARNLRNYNNRQFTISYDIG